HQPQERAQCQADRGRARPSAAPAALTHHRLRGRSGLRNLVGRLDVLIGGTHLMSLRRGRAGPDGKHGHVVDYRHVIHALRKKPMALLNLVYRERLFPREAYRRTFHYLLERHGERLACKTTVELLSLAHERGCEAQLAEVLSEHLDAGEAPDPRALGERFAPDPARLPEVVVRLAPLSDYEALIEQAQGEA